jgi:hypothetical protein
VFVLTLTVTKLVINRVQISLHRIWSSLGIWILTVRDWALISGLVGFIVSFSKDLDIVTTYLDVYHYDDVNIQIE